MYSNNNSKGHFITLKTILLLLFFKAFKELFMLLTIKELCIF